jgi:hypothetical protein
VSHHRANANLLSLLPPATSRLSLSRTSRASTLFSRRRSVR